jgi:hypothetical protein
MLRDMTYHLEKNAPPEEPDGAQVEQLKIIAAVSA